MVEKKPTPKSVAKAVEPKTAAPVEAEAEVKEAIDVAEIVEAPKPEAVEVAPVVVEPEVAKPVKAAVAVPPTTYAVVGGGTVDPVHLSKCVFKNTTHKRSLTVHHLQRRLNEWGYVDAYLDKDGYFGDLTLKSVNEFRAKHGIVTDLAMDAATFAAIFEGDTNVAVVID